MPTDSSHQGRSGDDAIANHVQTSNETSGYFLGTVPRGWMLQGGAQNLTVANQGLIHKQDKRQPTATSSGVGKRTHVASANAVQPTSSRPQQATSTLSRPETTLPAVSSDNDKHVNTQTVVGSSHVNDTVSLSHSSIAQSSALPVTQRENNASAESGPSPPSHGQIFTANPVIASRLPATSPANHLNGSAHAHPIIQDENASQPGPNYLNAPSNVAGSSSSLKEPSLPVPTNPSSRLTTTMPQIVSQSDQTANTHAPPQVSSASGSPTNPASSQNLARHQNPTAGANGYTAQLRVALPELLKNLSDRTAAISANAVPNSWDMLRISWLRAACVHGDVFCLILHQLICIQSAFPNFLSSNLLLAPRHIDGLVILNYVMIENRNLSPEVVRAFSDFFLPLVTLPYDRTLQVWMPKVKSVLERFTVQWEALRKKVFLRGCPPSAREIADELSSDSRVLSQIIYINFFNQLFPGADSSMSSQTLALFVKSQESLYENRQQPAWTIPRYQSADQELAAYMAAFKNISQRHYQHPATVYPSAPALSVPGTLQPHLTQVAPGSAVAANSHIPRPGLGMNIPTTTTAVMPAGAQRNAQPGPASRFFPNPGQLLPITVNPDPARSALHQVHLLNPPLIAEDDSVNFGSRFRIYSMFESFVGEPKMIDFNTVFETWSLTIPEEVFKRRAQHVAPPADNPFARVGRQVHSGSVIFNLRCVQLSRTGQSLSEAVYSASTTFWPENIFMSINEEHLDIRRKILHGRDLPIDVTVFVKQENNELKLTYHPTARENGKQFAVALEAVTIMGHKRALKSPTSIDAETSLAAITKSLGVADDGDDDLVMADSHVSIDLIDPFTARVFDRPVRGSSCLHRECFDLEAYLLSRNTRDKDGLIHSDEWRCPLCGKDARPASLIVDEFLVQVRTKLLADDKMDTKAILVKKDGTWEPKVEASRASRASTANRNKTPTDAEQRRSSSKVDETKDSGDTSITTDTPMQQDDETATIVSINDDDD